MAMFDARAAAKEHAERFGEEPFEFVGMDGETYLLPPFSTLTTGQARRLLQEDLDVLIEVAGDDAAAAVDALPLVLLDQLIEQWSGEVDETGKSGSASSRTPSKRKPSKRT